MNYSQQSVKAKIGSKSLDLAPMSNADVKLNDKNVRFLVELIMVGHNGEELYLIEKTRMTMKQGGRKMLLLFPKANNPKELTYSKFTILDQPFRANFSDEELDPADIPEYDRAYIRFEDR
jgi:hypothetical protein